MIFGVGTDLIEIKRVKKACEKQAFLSRTYTAEECRQAGEHVTRLAGNFAVKEAVAKAFGTGFRRFWPGDIEVLRDELGKPYVVLHGGAKVVAEELGIARIHVSISNTEEHALAYVIAEQGDKDHDAGKQADRGKESYETSCDRRPDEGH